MLTDHAALNFGNIWTAISHAPRTDAALLALLLLCVVAGASMALYIGAGLAYQYWNQEIAKRLRRRLRMRRWRSAVPQNAIVPEPAVRKDGTRLRTPGYPGLTAAAWMLVLICSVVAAASALTVEYFSGHRQTVAKRTAERELAQAPARLRIDYELRQH